LSLHGISWSYRHRGKRLLDVILVLIAVPALALPLAVIVAAVYLTLGSPVLFRQLRPGLGERPFELLKFRTMTDARDAVGRPLPDAKRLTRLGRFLRRTSLDELPELWNVLFGDMSLVGPRPLLVEYLHLYTAAQRRRHEVRPGITGWAQIHGRNAATWPEKFRYDLDYVEHLSFALDLRILVRTVSKVVRGEGVSFEGHATMPPFQGERQGERDG
jgi:lipopolysaccharide/colanic/teichoic acid biosynthesis glycosyltransferase